MRKASGDAFIDGHFVCTMHACFCVISEHLVFEPHSTFIMHA